MYQKKNELDDLGAKNNIRVLRYLYHNLNRSVSVSRIAQDLDISRANVHRGLKSLDALGILRRSKTERRMLVRIDGSSRLASPLFFLFNEEEYREVDPNVREILSMLFHPRSMDDISMAVLFGSHARGTANERSDIDILLVTEKKGTAAKLKRSSRSYLPENRIEVHHYLKEDMKDPKDMVVIDSILFGIAIIGEGDLFRYRCEVESVKRSYLVQRVRSAEENMKRAIQIEGEGKRYFEKVAWVSLGEVESILRTGKTVPKTEIATNDKFDERIKSVKKELSRRGDRIWLI